MMRLVGRLIILTGTLFMLSGCNVSSFNPYKHMSDIIRCKSQKEFADMRDYVLAHTDESLQQQIIFERNGDVLDTAYQVTELNIWTETSTDGVNLMGEYRVTTTAAPYYMIAFFTYKDDMLVSYSYTITSNSNFSLGEM